LFLLQPQPISSHPQEQVSQSQASQQPGSVVLFKTVNFKSDIVFPLSDRVRLIAPSKGLTYIPPKHYSRV